MKEGCSGRHARQTAERGKDQVLDYDLSRDLSASGADSEPRGNLFPARAPSGQVSRPTLSTLSEDE